MTGPGPYAVHARNLAVESDNKIHDDDVARRLGFGGGLVPGVEVFAYATQPFAAAWGVELLARGALSIRFRRPVYDGEQVVVEVAPTEEDADERPADEADAGGYDVSVVGADGVVRAVGHASLLQRPPAVDPAQFPDRPRTEPLPPADAASLAPGTVFATVSEEVSAEAHDGYLDGIGEQLPLYRDARHLHPGALLRMVNAVLFRNVVLGPWIHTSSDVRLLAAATAPATLTARGVVTDAFERNGNAYVRYDALVLAGERPVLHADHVAIYSLAALR